MSANPRPAVEPPAPRRRTVSETRRLLLVEAGQQGNAVRTTLNEDDTLALAECYRLLNRIAKKHRLNERLAATIAVDGD